MSQVLLQPAAAPCPSPRTAGSRCAPQNRPHMQKLLHFHRSAIDPVGIVAVVSMKATM